MQYLLFFQFFVLSFFSFAQEKPLFNQPLSVITVSPGKVIDFSIHMKLPDGYHAYLDQFKVQNISPQNYKVGNVRIKPEIEFFDKFSKKNKRGFKDQGEIILQIEPDENINSLEKNNEQKLVFELRYQICSEKFCYLPQYQKISIDTLFTDKQIIQSNTSENSNYLLSKFESAVNVSWILAFIIVFFAGILTSLTPCIFPMIPITVSILGYDAEKNSRTQNLIRSLLYVAGIAFTYSLLGVTASMTGKIFGSILTNKWVIGFMVVLFFTMALSMWGLFDIQVPAFIRNKFGNSSKQGYLGLFIMGLFAGIVASPCVGPVLVAILSYVSLTQNVFLGGALLFTYAVGLGLIFILIGLTGQALALLPKSGRWMNKIKFFLGLLMFITGLYYLQFVVPYKDWLSSQKIVKDKASIVSSAKWLPYSKDNIELAKKLQKPVIIDFRADWCAACYELDEKSFSRPEFISLSDQFLLLKVDATEETDAVQAIIKSYDVKGLPTVIFMNRKGELLKHLTFTQFLDWHKIEPKMQEALKQ